MPKVVIHDFRVVDRVLADTDPDAGDVVFLGPVGTTALPFVVRRRVSGPGGWYVDACEILDSEGAVIASRSLRGTVRRTIEHRVLWSRERTFEIEGESVPTDLADEVRGLVFPKAGSYTLRYSVYDDHILDAPFVVLAEDPPHGVIVDGPLDAALSKSTIAWVGVPGGGDPRGVWYGYEGGRVYVLVGPDEQEIPGLAGSASARLAARSKEKQSLVAEAVCSVAVLTKDREWDRIARDLMIGRRLNLTDGERALDRWRATCEIVALTPQNYPAADG